MNKKCGKCAKTVYPTEELKCLDKSWHKGCFRCWECGMALNMRTYKGFNKLPYCEAHIPKPKATTVAETPELARIAENTKIQSNVKYHAEFEAAKGKFTTVADDPETLRIKQNTKIISNAAYHGELEKKADMDQRRHLTGENGDPVAPPPAGQPPRQEHRPAAAAAPAPANPQVARLASNNNYGGGGGGLGASPHSARSAQASTVIYTSEHGAVNAAPVQKVGSIRDYDPLNEQYGSVAQAARYSQPQSQPQQHYQPAQQSQPQQQYGGYQQSQQQPYRHQPQQQYGGYQQQQYQQQQQQPAQQQPQQPYGYRPDHGGYRSQQTYRSETQQPPPQQHHQPHHQPQQHHQPAYQSQHHQPAHQSQNQPQHQSQQHHQPQSQPPQQQRVQSSGRCYRAMYDYDAADHDEISFRDGDLLVSCQPIDDGWMTGTCQRTGQRGMLPANYVEPVDL